MLPILPLASWRKDEGPPLDFDHANGMLGDVGGAKALVGSLVGLVFLGSKKKVCFKSQLPL